MRPHLALMLGAALSLAAPTLHAQPDKAPSKTEREKAKALFDKAEAYYKVREYEKALAGYKESYLTVQEPALLYNMAQCYRLLGKSEEALSTYRSFLRDVPDTPLREKVEGFMAELAKGGATTAGASIKIFSEQDPAEVFLDGEAKGQSPLLLERVSPGKHIIELRKAGFRSFEQELSVEPGKDQALKATLESADAAKPGPGAPTPTKPGEPEALKPEPAGQPSTLKKYWWVIPAGVGAVVIGVVLFSGGNRVISGGNTGGSNGGF
jgi:tetratricopeptide (TPR) repeat protein